MKEPGADNKPFSRRQRLTPADRKSKNQDRLSRKRPDQLVSTFKPSNLSVSAASSQSEGATLSRCVSQHNTRQPTESETHALRVQVCALLCPQTHTHTAVLRYLRGLTNTPGDSSLCLSAPPADRRAPYTHRSRGMSLNTIQSPLRQQQK